MTPDEFLVWQRSARETADDTMEQEDIKLVHGSADPVLTQFELHHSTLWSPRCTLWAPNVVWHLRAGPRRFGELRVDIPLVSAKVCEHTRAQFFVINCFQPHYPINGDRVSHQV
jgi:hypothetical protein